MNENVWSQWKKLDCREFFPPNNILCYGGGQMSFQQIPRMLRSGMNIVGVIDKDRIGKVLYGKCDLECMSVEDAFDRFGFTVKIIITISDEDLFEEITENLVSVGFLRENIYGYDIYNWLTVSSEKCYCWYLFSSINYAVDGFMFCCLAIDDMQHFRFEPFDKSYSFDDHIQRMKGKIQWYHEQAKKGNIPLHCKECPFLEKKAIPEHPQYSSLAYGSHSICNFDCIYCEYSLSRKSILGTPFYTPEEDAENYVRFVSFMQKYGMMSDCAMIHFAGGELSILPARKSLLKFAKSNTKCVFNILSNCAIYCEEIVEILDLNEKNRITCDLDAGTPETYLLVKGFSCYENVIRNLEVYAKHGRIHIKYIVMPGFNTQDEDFYGQIEILERLGIDTLILSRDRMKSKDVFEQRKEIYCLGKFASILEERKHKI